jgi:hypothetical protein
VAHNAEQVMNAYRGLVSLLEASGYAITNIPDQVLRASLNGRLKDLLTKLNAWHDKYWNALQGDAVHKGPGVYWIPGPETVKADADLLAHRIWAQKLHADVASVQPPTEKGMKIRTIMQQGSPLFSTDNLFSDTLDEAYAQLKKAIKALVEGLWYVAKIVIGIYVGYKALQWMGVFEKKAPAAAAGPAARTEPPKLTRKQRKKQERAQRLQADAREMQREARELQSGLPRGARQRPDVGIIR